MLWVKSTLWPWIPFILFFSHASISVLNSVLSLLFIFCPQITGLNWLLFWFFRRNSFWKVLHDVLLDKWNGCFRWSLSGPLTCTGIHPQVAPLFLLPPPLDPLQWELTFFNIINLLSCFILIYLTNVEANNTYLIAKT